MDVVSKNRSGSDNERSSGTLRLLAICVIVAVAICLVLVVVWPSTSEDEPAAAIAPVAVDQTSNDFSEGDARATNSNSQVNATSTVQLPSVAVPATATQLEAEARAATDRLVEMFPDSAEALHVKAMMHAQLRETSKAEELWRRCIEFAPTSERYYVNVAAIAMDRGDSQLAVDTLRKLVDAGCTSPDVLHHYGLSLTNIGETGEATRILERAVELYPRSPAHWMVLGQAQLKLNDLDAAESSLLKAVKLGAGSPDVYFSLANVSARLKKQEAASKYQDRYQELKKSQPLDAQQRFKILSTAEARRTAMATLTEAAAVFAMQGDSLAAETFMLRVLALEPTNMVACNALAKHYRLTGMLVEEQVVRRRITELQPLSFDSHLIYAKTCAELGQNEKAEAALKLAISLQPNAVVGYAAMSEFYMDLGRGKFARWYAQEAVRRHPSPVGYRLLAETCKLTGDETARQFALAEAAKLEQQ